MAEVERIAKHDNRYKSENQMRLWRNPRKRAVNNLIEALDGRDIPVKEVDHAVALAHKAWWISRIADEGLSLETANKDFANMAGMLRRYYESIAQPDAPEPYHRVVLRDRLKEDNRKQEIPVDWILDRWFAPGAFDRTNAEARDILLISIETGCRQSEIYDLPPNAIVLDGPIPHLRIGLEEGENRREAKNSASIRLVPLVGVALAAARRHPNGFARYRGRSSYSAAMNSYLRANGLLPSPEHTIGGVRHTWESRLKKAGVSAEDRGVSMGHSVKAIREREVYGDAMPLVERLEIARSVMLPVPDHLR
ncbi:MAG: hypothetical protein KDK28_17935 [Maritimibacter sp.]|nr:hypothetical protein [Maritimibacter sp.]